MNHLYTLYDALLGIDVPPERARAVVDAMEHDMAGTLSTKQDLDSQSILLRHDMEVAFALMRRDMDTSVALLRKDMDANVATLRVEMNTSVALLRNEIATVRTDLGNDIRALDAKVDAQGLRLEARIDAQAGVFAKDLRLTAMHQTIRTGLMLYSGMALLFAALRWLP